MYKKFRGDVTKVSVMVIASILVVLNSPWKVFQKTNLKVKPKKTYTQYDVLAKIFNKRVYRCKESFANQISCLQNS